MFVFCNFGDILLSRDSFVRFLLVNTFFPGFYYKGTSFLVLVNMLLML